MNFKSGVKGRGSGR